MKKDDILTSELLYFWSSVSDEPRYMVHSHREHEIHYFIRGDVEYQVEGRRYIIAPESLLLIPAGDIHGFTNKSSSLHQRVSIHFLPELLDEEERGPLMTLFQSGGLYFPDLSKSEIGFLIQSILDSKTMEKALQKMVLKHRTISLLTHLYQIHSQDMAGSTPAVNERIQAVLRYLNSRLKEPLTLEQITQRFRISKNHLNVLFRRETGTTINQYLRIKRLVLAHQEIQNGCGIEEAAYRSGFNDYSNFYRAYRSFFGVRPSGIVSKWREIQQEISL